MEVSSGWKTLKQALLGRQPMRSNKEDLGISGSKTRFAFLNPTLYCVYFAIIVMLVSCVVWLLACESMFETLRTMFGLSVGVNKVFSWIFVGFYHLSLLKLLLTVFEVFLFVLKCLNVFERKIRKFEKKSKRFWKNSKESFLCVVT